jgi:23S rRNA pseudouridine2605 synthase
MTTENDEWKPRNRYNDSGLNEDGQREKRPYQSYNRSSYGNSSGNYRQPGNYDRQQSNYDRQQSNYDRQGGNYNRPRPNNDRLNTGNYNRQGNNYNNSWGGNNYERRENDYNSRPQRSSYDTQRSSYDNYSRPYDNQQRSYDGNRQSNSADNQSLGKKRRPRVGEVPTPVRNTNYYSGPQNQPGNYNRDTRGGYQQQQRPNFKPANRNFQGNRNMAPNPNAKYSVKKQLKYREEHFDLNEPIRLNKYLSNSGVCSRREADEFIKAGLVKVNGETVSELGTKVKRSDAITFHNDPVKLEHKVYVLLNKPKNCVTTADDPQERLTVMDLVKNACQERIVPVGRLDRNTTGVLLLTNDGDLASKLTHPKFLKKKIYHVWLDKDVSVDDMQKLAEGVELEDGEIHADAVSYVSETDKDQVGIEIHSGRNRVVRRMLEALGYHVIKLDRVYFAGLTKKNLKRGQWRYLNDKEVSMLRMGAFD